MKFPRVSIITNSYNTPLPVLDKCLKAVAIQKYPKKRIQHIVMDAGSKNGSIDLAKQYGCTVVVRKDLRYLSQKRMSIGIQKSTGDLILFLEADNIMTSDDWLPRMVEPFADDRIIGSFSMHNSYTKDMSALSIYFSLIGANDPILVHLHKSEKNLIYQNRYEKGQMLYENERFACVKFAPNTLPTLGDNGHMVRKKIIDKVNTNPDSFIHVDAFYKLAQQKYDTYAVVKNSIIHDNCPDNDVYKAAVKRVEFKKLFTDNPTISRSYRVFDRKSVKDIRHLALFVLCSITVFPMVLFSIVGYIRHPNRAWFFHPVVCFVEAWMYALSEIRMLLYNRTYDK